MGPLNGPQVEAFYPPNAYKTFGPVLREYASRNPTSFHAGGVNVALCDGSVRFIKDSIDSWAIDPTTGVPPGIRSELGEVGDVVLYTTAPGTYFGVWQRLSTRNFGEVIGGDSYRPGADERVRRD